jgi:uncharacterized membrane protein HdeD (DUF308 family)
MSVPLQLNLAASGTPASVAPQRIAVVRSLFALVWAALLVLAVGDKVPTTAADVPTGAALLLASYPLIDAIASLAGAAFADARVLRANAAISTLAAVAIGIAAFGSDAGSTLAAFGAWAAVSGAIQLAIAIHRRRAEGRQLPMIVSGGLSTIAGITFLAASGNDKAHLAALAGYMALGALLFLLWASRGQANPATAR